MKYNFLKDLEDLELLENIDLSKYTTMRLKKNGDFLLVRSIGALSKVIPLLNQNGIQYHLVGWGANQIIHTTDNVLFINLRFPFYRDQLKQIHKEYILPASVPLNVLTSHAQKFGLKGWEVFTGIPASLGGAIFMNAGTALGEIGSLVKWVKVVQKNGRIKKIIINNESFSYRKNHFVEPGEVIIEVCLTHLGQDEAIKNKIKEYMKFRKESQPLASYNCGCVFKNYDQSHKAGQFIDITGLKGLTVNDLKISPLHANFIENSGQATSEDFLEMVDVIQFSLEVFTGIKFELEAKVY